MQQVYSLPNIDAVTSKKNSHFRIKKTVEEVIDETRENRILEKHQKLQKHWNKLREQFALKTDRLPAQTAICSGEEFREKLEVLDNLERAIPLKEKFARSSWYSTLRFSTDEIISIGNEFSGLSFYKKAGSRPLSASMKTPWMKDVAQFVETEKKLRTTFRTWRDNKYLQEKMKKYKTQMENSRFDFCDAVDIMEIKGSGIVEDEKIGLQEKRNAIEKSDECKAVELQEKGMSEILISESDTTKPDINDVICNIELGSAFFTCLLHQVETKIIHMHNPSSAAIKFQIELEESSDNRREAGEIDNILIADDNREADKLLKATDDKWSNVACANFTQQTFSVFPLNGCIAPGESIKLLVSFRPTLPGCFFAQAHIHTTPNAIVLSPCELVEGDLLETSAVQLLGCVRIEDNHTREKQHERLGKMLSPFIPKEMSSESIGKKKEVITNARRDAFSQHNAKYGICFTERVDDFLFKFEDKLMLIPSIQKAIRVFFEAIMQRRHKIIEDEKVRAYKIGISNEYTLSKLLHQKMKSSLPLYHFIEKLSKSDDDTLTVEKLVHALRLNLYKKTGAIAPLLSLIKIIPQKKEREMMRQQLFDGLRPSYLSSRFSGVFNVTQNDENNVTYNAVYEKLTQYFDETFEHIMQQKRNTRIQAEAATETKKVNRAKNNSEDVLSDEAYVTLAEQSLLDTFTDAIKQEKQGVLKQFLEVFETRIFSQQQHEEARQNRLHSELQRKVSIPGSGYCELDIPVPIFHDRELGESNLFHTQRMIALSNLQNKETVLTTEFAEEAACLTLDFDLAFKNEKRDSNAPCLFAAKETLLCEQISTYLISLKELESKHYMLECINNDEHGESPDTMKRIGEVIEKIENLISSFERSTAGSLFEKNLTKNEMECIEIQLENLTEMISQGASNIFVTANFGRLPINSLILTSKHRKVLEDIINRWQAVDDNLLEAAKSHSKQMKADLNSSLMKLRTEYLMKEIKDNCSDILSPEILSHFSELAVSSTASWQSLYPWYQILLSRLPNKQIPNCEFISRGEILYALSSSYGVKYLSKRIASFPKNSVFFVENLRSFSQYNGIGLFSRNALQDSPENLLESCLTSKDSESKAKQFSTPLVSPEALFEVIKALMPRIIRFGESSRRSFAQTLLSDVFHIKTVVCNDLKSIVPQIYCIECSNLSKACGHAPPSLISMPPSPLFSTVWHNSPSRVFGLQSHKKLSMFSQLFSRGHSELFDNLLNEITSSASLLSKSIDVKVREKEKTLHGLNLNATTENEVQEMQSPLFELLGGCQANYVSQPVSIKAKEHFDTLRRNANALREKKKIALSMRPYCLAIYSSHSNDMKSLAEDLLKILHLRSFVTHLFITGALLRLFAAVANIQIDDQQYFQSPFCRLYNDNSPSPPASKVDETYKVDRCHQLYQYNLSLLHKKIQLELQWAKIIKVTLTLLSQEDVKIHFPKEILCLYEVKDNEGKDFQSWNALPEWFSNSESSFLLSKCSSLIEMRAQELEKIEKLKSLSFIREEDEETIGTKKISAEKIEEKQKRRHEMNMHFEVFSSIFNQPTFSQIDHSLRLTSLIASPLFSTTSTLSTQFLTQENHAPISSSPLPILSYWISIESPSLTASQKDLSSIKSYCSLSKKSSRQLEKLIMKSSAVLVLHDTLHSDARSLSGVQEISKDLNDRLNQANERLFFFLQRKMDVDKVHLDKWDGAKEQLEKEQMDILEELEEIRRQEEKKEKRMNRNLSIRDDASVASFTDASSLSESYADSDWEEEIDDQQDEKDGELDEDSESASVIWVDGKAAFNNLQLIRDSSFLTSLETSNFLFATLQQPSLFSLFFFQDS